MSVESDRHERANEIDVPVPGGVVLLFYTSQLKKELYFVPYVYCTRELA